MTATFMFQNMIILKTPILLWWVFCDTDWAISIKCHLPGVFSELAREEKGEQWFRSGTITPNGIIDEDFEEELGSPVEVR